MKYSLYQGINVIQYVIHLNTGNYKTLLREIKEDLNKQKDIMLIS